MMFKFASSAIAFLSLATSTIAAATVLTPQLATTSAPEGSQYSYYSLGCYPDSSTSRVLRGAYFDDPWNFQVPDCTSFCNANGYQYAGLENGSECYCDSQIHTDPERVDIHECNSPCTGNNVWWCGGVDRIQIFARDPAFPESA